jgi:hypothetical protein
MRSSGFLDYFPGYMFKKKFGRSAPPSSFSFLILSILGTFLLFGCRSAAPLPAADFSQPGWKVRQGEAVWKRGPKGPELAGDLTLATAAPGRTVVQFSKTPFPIVTAQNTADAWEIQIPVQNKRHSGHGRPPHQIFWLYVPQMLAGEHPPRGWKVERLPDNHFRLHSWATGESLEGYLSE